MRALLKFAAVVMVLYIALVGALLVAMYQPPARLGKVMAKAPGPLLGVLPFQSLWLMARAGRLQPGEVAPDFNLETVDKQSRVRLSSFRGDKPVVLIFGSYT